ncbi:iron complex transport system substrate-binding protein [Desulfosarcina sp. BuS5]|nr:iron complex transport system substrate-binding protein [Desulfosarcina sp. BuS5]
MIRTKCFKLFKFLFAVIYIFLIAGIFGGTAAIVSAGGEPSHPRRIVCLETYPAEIICDLGEMDRIAAVSKFQKHNSYYTFLKNKPVVGGGVGSNINLEMILGVNPDLVFCSYGQADILKTRGLNVYCTKTYNIEGIMELITDIGKIAGKEKEAKKIVAEMKARIQRVEVKVKEVKKRPLVYFEQSSLGKTRSKGSLTHELITRAGGINIAKDEPVPFPLLSQEFIIKKNPDIIILEEWGTKPSSVKERDGWKNIKAVKSGKIFQSKSYYTGYTQRCLDGLEEYAKSFYPELFNK